MSKKILINGITLDGIGLNHSNLIPLLHKIKVWQSLGCHISIFSNSPLKKKIDSYGIINSYEFIELKYSELVDNRISFVLESLKRNLIAFACVGKLKNKYDVVYSISSVLDLVLFPWFLKLIDKRICLITVFDNKVNWRGSGSLLIRLLNWVFFHVSLFLIKKADKIFTVSYGLQAYLVAKGFEALKIGVTGNAVQSDLIHKAKKGNKYNFDAIFIGRIHPSKGIYDALAVLSVVKKIYPNFQFAVMGRGDVNEERKFFNKIHELSLSRNVEILGYLEGLEKFNILKSSKCFLFLSESESFGQSLLEAVTCGLPAIAYDLKPYREIYRNDEVFFVKRNDIEAVTKKVLEIFREGKFENVAGKFLLEKFCWEKIAKQEFQAFSGVEQEINMP